MRIVILEDNEDRRIAMMRVLRSRFPKFAVEFFTASKPLIQHLTETLTEPIRLISLDNDLDMTEVDGNWIDQGEGLDVAQWLSAHSAVCPVVIHTTNMPAGDQMMSMLKASHWSVDRVVPYEGERWIDETWASAIKRLLR